MSRSVNTVILLGNCGKDPEVRYTASGKPVANLSLAINESFKDPKGEWQERTHWVSIVAWRRLAEIVGEYVEKGTRLYVQGRLNTESWEDRNHGGKQYRISVVAEKLVVLERTRERNEEKQGSRGGNVTESETSENPEDVPF